jgi:hypothetical protein
MAPALNLDKGRDERRRGLMLGQAKATSLARHVPQNLIYVNETDEPRKK